MPAIKNSRSVRVDLFGGTLDIPPIHLILHRTVTLNVAVSLKSHVSVTPSPTAGLTIVSRDYSVQKNIPYAEWTYENIYQRKIFGEMSFVVQICDAINLPSLTAGQGLALEFWSDIPPGSGLGGSSVMGVCLMEALNDYFQLGLGREDILTRVKGIEARVLDCGPTGYQDYYPSLYGGVLALRPGPQGIEVEQLFSPELKDYLESHLTLIYSGQGRFSAINNWEVYKAFFDKETHVRKGLQDLADIAFEAYSRIKNRQFDFLPRLIMEEGSCRQKLFSRIVTPAMQDLFQALQKKYPSLGLKVCGAGGGGCFLLSHDKEEGPKISRDLQSMDAFQGMKRLEFGVEGPVVVAKTKA